jgi:hypothetical protein
MIWFRQWKRDVSEMRLFTFNSVISTHLHDVDELPIPTDPLE